MVARPIVYDTAPDLGLHHVGGTIRYGSSRALFLLRWGWASPGTAALLFWAAVWAFRHPAWIGNPFPAAVVAWWAHIGAQVFTIAFAGNVLADLLGDTPTHQFKQGQWRALRHQPPWRGMTPGTARVRHRGGKLDKETRQARKDLNRVAKLGAKRRDWWAQQHALEDRLGVERTRPGLVDRTVMKAKPVPSKKAKAKAAKKAGAAPGPDRKPRGKAARRQLDRDFDAAAAQADALFTPRPVLPVPPDPTVPAAQAVAADPYASDRERVSAGILDALAVETREHAAADPYASPVEQGRALAGEPT